MHLINGEMNANIKIMTFKCMKQKHNYIVVNGFNAIIKRYTIISRRQLYRGKCHLLDMSFIRDYNQSYCYEGHEAHNRSQLKSV